MADWDPKLESGHWGEGPPTSSEALRKIAELEKRLRTLGQQQAGNALPKGLLPPFQPPKVAEQPGQTDDVIRSSLGKLATSSWYDTVRDFSKRTQQTDIDAAGTRGEKTKGETLLGGDTSQRLNRAIDNFSKILDDFYGKSKDKLGGSGGGGPDQRFFRPQDVLRTDSTRSSLDRLDYEWAYPAEAPDVIGARGVGAGRGTRNRSLRTRLRAGSMRANEMARELHAGGLDSEAHTVWMVGETLKSFSGGAGSLAGPLALGMKTVEAVGNHFLKAFAGTYGSFGKAVGSERAFEAGGHMADSIAHMTSMPALGSGAGATFYRGATAIAMLAGSVMKAVDGLGQFSEQLHASNMKLAEFSPSMVGVQMRQQVRDTMLGIRRGERRSDVAEYVAESKTKLETETSKWTDFFANLKGVFTGGAASDTAGVLEKLNAIVEEMKKGDSNFAAILRKYFNNDSVNDHTNAFFHEMMDEGWDGSWERPPRWND